MKIDRIAALERGAPAVMACAVLFMSLAQAQTKKAVGILLVAGDIAVCSPNPTKSVQATADLIQKEIDQADKAGLDVRVLALGDLAYPEGESFDCFDKTWGKFKARILPAPGNHDFGTKSKDGAAYRAYFKSTLKSLKADKSRVTYGVDFPSADKLPTGEKQWRLFALNSNNSDKGQRDWLDGELSKIKGQRCSLTFAHAFAYSSGRHGHADKKGKPQNSVIDLSKPLLPGNMMRMFAIMHTHRASVFLAGHDHHYEQLARANAEAKADDLGASAATKDGVRSFIVGTGGALLHSEHPTGNDYAKKWEAFQEAYDLKSHGVLKITLYSASYEWKFLPIKDNAASFKAIKDVKFDDTCNGL